MSAPKFSNDMEICMEIYEEIDYEIINILFTYTSNKKQQNVARYRYTSPMDPSWDLKNICLYDMPRTQMTHICIYIFFFGRFDS